MKSLRILELGNAAAVEFCGKLFAGLGASVVRVRPGAGAASLPPIQEQLTPEYAWYNTGKSNAAVDLDSPAGRGQLGALLQAADVVLDGLGPGRLEALGVDVAALSAARPELTLVRVTPFGLTGPYKDFLTDEITLYAMSGMMVATGDGAREPLNAGGRIASTAAGQTAFVAALIGLYNRGRCGTGGVVDLSIQESGMDVVEIALADFMKLGGVARRNNDEHRMVPWRTYPCKDGEVLIISGPARRWPRACAVFGEPRLWTEFVGITSRMANRKEVEKLMQPWLMANDRMSIYHTLQGHGLASSYLATLTEAMDNPQNTARKAFLELDQPGLGRMRMPDAPFKAALLPWQTRPAPAPDSGEDPAALWPARPAPKVGRAAAPSRPLEGVRVIDFSHDWAGPHAARLMADYGADVIKVEYPLHLDGMRGGSVEKCNDHPRFWQLHRGKRSITLDLNIPEQLEVCKKLIASADVVLENSRPGVMDRMGVGHEAMLKLNPKLVFISLSAFGATGPEAQYAGYGGTLETISGLQSVTAYDEASPRMRVREMDVLNGVFGTCAVMAALLEVQASGRGQWIDLSECETSAWLVGEFFAACSLSGREDPPRGNRHPEYVQGLYPSAGEDRWIAITARDEREWAALLDVIGANDWKADARFAAPASRRAQQDLIDTRLKAWAAQRSDVQAMQELQAAGVPAGAVLNARDLAGDAHLAARNWFMTTPDGARLPGYPFHFLGAAPHVPLRGPKLGEHNEAILGPLGLPRSAWPDLRPEKIRFADYVDPALIEAVTKEFASKAAQG